MSRRRLGAEILRYSTGRIPSPCPKKKNSKLQEMKQKDPRIPFAKMTESPSGFRSSGELAFLQGGTEEESCSEGKKTQEASDTKDWAPRGPEL